MAEGSGLLKRAGGWCRSRWCSLAVKLLGFALFLVVDPLGLASDTSRTSQELVYRVISLFRGDTGPRPVSLVLIDDRSAPEFNRERGYPLTFSQHASILRPIMCTAPAALFIDITFRGVRSDTPPDASGAIDPELDELMRVLSGTDPAERERCLLMGLAPAAPVAPTKVMIARVRSIPPSPCDPLYGRQLSEDCVVGRALDHLARVAEPISLSPVARDGTYPIVTFGEDAGTAEPQASAALSMLFAYCERATPEQRSGLAGCRDRQELLNLVAPNASRTRVQMYPSWTYFFSSALMADRATSIENVSRDGRRGVSCPRPQDDGAAGPLSHLATAAAELWHAVIQGGRESGVADGRDFGQGACVATDTFTALDVRNMSSQCGQDGTLCSKRLDKFFAGRAVVYGVDIVGINDKVESPVLGWVPGAAFHAAAAETLLAKGSGYAYAMPITTIAGIEFRCSILVDFMLALVLLLSMQTLWCSGYRKFLIYSSLALVLLLLITSFTAAYINGLPFAKLAIATLLISGAFALMGIYLAADDSDRWGALARAGGGLIRFAIALLIVPPIVSALALLLSTPPPNVAALLLLATIATDEVGN